MSSKVTKQEQQYVEIAGVNLPKFTPASESEQLLVPAIEPSYIWGQHTFDVCSDLLENKAVILTGHAGAGKSSVFRQIAAQLNQPVVAINLDSQMAVSELVGSWKIRGGEMVWVDGLFTFAMRNGYWVILDELDRAEPHILVALNTVTELVTVANPHRVMALKEKDQEILRAHPNFRICATGNTVGAMSKFRHLYQGARLLDESLLDRFRVYVVNYLAAVDEVNVLLKKYPTLIKPLAERLVEIANLIRQAAEREEIRTPFSHRRMFDWVDQIMRHAKNPDLKTAVKKVLHAADAVIFSKIPVSEDIEVIKEIIKRVLGDK